MERLKLTDARQLDWTSARKAFERGALLCSNAGFVAPEDLEQHHHYVLRVCAELDAVVVALLLTPPTSTDVVYGSATETAGDR